MTRVLAAATVAAGLAVASAQNLTPGCQSAFGTIVTNQEASACLAPSTLVGVVAGNTSTSLVDPINSWLGSLCSAGACSNTTLDFIVNTVVDGCATELSLLGYSSNQKSSIQGLVKQYYPTVREVVCLKEGNDICITKQLKGVEASVGTLSIDNIVKLAMGGGNSTIPKDVYCSNCSKAQYNLLNTRIPGSMDGSKSEFQSQCGASFVDGQEPSGITQSAAATTGNNGNNGANMLSAFSSTFATFLAVGGAFAMVA